MKIIIINGPNLNLLGKRETSIYGSESFEMYYETLKKRFPDIDFVYYQSNIEGEIINKIHEYGFSADGIIINAGAYTHTSVAIRDAIAGIKTTVVRSSYFEYAHP
jgi:3-dehydroquinate dehydratase II